MRLYKTSEYALRVLIYMANMEQEKFSVNQLHKDLDIPYKYLGRLMPRLAEAGFIEAHRGKMGGYTFNRSLDDIYLYQVIDVVEGWENYDRCILGFHQCSNDNPCPVHQEWGPIKIQMLEMFKTTSLKDAVKKGITKF